MKIQLDYVTNPIRKWYSKILLLCLILIFVGCEKENIVPEIKIEIKEITEITHNSANVNVEIPNDNKRTVLERGICLGEKSNPDVNNSQCFSKGKGNGSFIVFLSGLIEKSQYFVRPYAKDSVGCHYGAENSFTTKDLPPKPKNVDSFSINVSLQKRLISGVYIPLMKQYKLTVQEYSKVEYNWNCSDKSVQGIIVSTRAYTPIDGIIFKSSYSEVYNPSGNKLFPIWDGLAGYLVLHIRTFNSNYVYSSDELMVQKMIEAPKTYDIWSDKPSL